MNTQLSSGQRETGESEGVTQLDFNQAMADFRTMFPNMDVEVIEAVLRENQGVVDATIDSLLAMTTDNELEVTRRSTFSPDGTPVTERAYTPPPSYNQVAPLSADSLIRPVSPRGTNPLAPFAKQGILGTPMRYSRGWKPALLGRLPPDFLRIEPARAPRSSQELLPSGRLLLQRFDENSAERGKDSGHSPQVQQLLDDERLALLLQSAEFVSALRNDQDFMQTLDTEQPALPKRAATVPEPHVAGAASTLRENDDEAAFRERLRNMGRVSRRKFAQLARVFFRGRRPQVGGATNKDRLILCDEDDDWSFVEEQPNPASSGATLNKSRIP